MLIRSRNRFGAMDHTNNPSSMRICKHDVFLSFRGPDTRNNFIDHLYHHLINKGISVFKDDQCLQKGDFISPQLLRAIRDSRISIVVFSKNYSESSWCLEEMATVADCRRELKQTVIPVFYDVDPSHVRKQIGVYEDDYNSHNKKFKYDLNKVHRWQKAMTELANLVGFDLRDKPEFTEIEKIVQQVIKTLDKKFSGLTNDLVGMQPRIEELEKLLKLNSQDDDFRVLGIWGMGGVGKTTHATLLYEKISYQFDARCFIHNTRKIYMDGGIVALQKQILGQALDERNLDSYDTCEIAGIMINGLHSGIKFLLVLDDVDRLAQLQELGINPKLLCPGSRIIITTRNAHILSVYGTDTIYEVPLLNSNDACELFQRKAFKGEEQSSNCIELIPEIVKYTGHLPLTIRVVGSFLCTRDASQWRDALDRLRKNQHNNGISNVLKMSVDGLEHADREIFLHIACFFIGEREDYVKRILDACGLHNEIGFQRILEKSFITIENQEINMHDLVQDLGREIVRVQSPNEPGLRSRLWYYYDFQDVLISEEGANNVKAIVLDQRENSSQCRAEGFSNLRNLELLILYHNNFSGNLNFLSNNLRYFLWHGYPFTYLPSNFEPYYLVELNMPDSSIQRLWEGRKDLPYLKRMDLSNSKFLTETPKFFWTPVLERLDFTGCTNLIQVHPSIGHLTELVFLSLQNCSSLVNLDFGSVSNLHFLRVLRLSGCTKLEKTPDFTGASNLEYLDMDGCTSLSTVHESIGALAKLRFLSLRDCKILVEIPNSINNMTSLVTLDLCGCLKLATLTLRCSLSSSHLKSLIVLDVSFCNLCRLDAIGELQCLERLSLQGNSFDVLPSISRLRCLAYLNLAHCRKLQTLPRIHTLTAPSLVGSYFKMTSGSRDHRSGIYIFDCPGLKFSLLDHQEYFCKYITRWLQRLIQKPHHFRCGFDIIVPWDWKHIDDPSSLPLPNWFHHQLGGHSIIRIVQSNVNDNWIGFSFCVAFEVNNRPASSGPSHGSLSSALPHPFFLSFESEHTEERFDMPLGFELDKIDGSKHLWIIYISREHCHFVKTGARITFKACPGLVIKRWGLCMLIKKTGAENLSSHSNEFFDCFEKSDLMFDYVEESISRSGPKIQLPYNWLVTEEEEVENSEAKSKEIDLSNLGL